MMAWLEGAGERHRDDWMRAAYGAWQGAVLPRMKRFPKLADVLKPFQTRRRKKRFSRSDWLAWAAMFTAMHGGKDLRDRKE